MNTSNMNTSNQERSVSAPDADVAGSIGMPEVVPILIPGQASRPPASLARRISSRTTDLLAIAIIFIGSLTLGRQILEWWRAEPPPILDAGPLAGLETEWGADGEPVELEFADQPVRLIRQTVARAKPSAVLGLVQETCQKALFAAQPPELPPDQAELEMLKTISGRQPDVEQAGEWQIHRLGGNMVMLVGVRNFSVPTEKTVPLHPASGLRVVCWGLVFPGISSGSWTAYTFIKTNSNSKRARQSGDISRTTDLESRERESGDPGSRELNLAEVQLPAGSRRTVSLRGTGWNGLLGFQGHGDALEWQHHFSTWLEAKGWIPAEDWHSADEVSGWSASFMRKNENSTNSNRILIQFQFDASGQGSGIIHGLPGRTANPKP